MDLCGILLMGGLPCAGKKPRDQARKKDMRELYQKAERGELNDEKTTERTASALVQRYLRHHISLARPTDENGDLITI